MATMTTADIATTLETDPRTLRKFLRADAKAQGTETPGKGSRYAIEKRTLPALRKRFAKWDEARTAPETDNSDNAPATVSLEKS